jgi:hypothetical protein
MRTNPLSALTRTHKLVASGALLAAAASAGAVASAQTPARPTRVAPVSHARRGRRTKPHRKAIRRPRPASHHTAPATATAYPSSSGGYSIPASIVMCESGGNYGAVNPTTGAGGAYQILPSTWAAYGGTGLPQDAPPAEQDAIAARIYATAGPSQWSCG